MGSAMLVEVTLLNARGKPLFKKDLGPKCRGELEILENRLHTLGRAVSCATLKCTTDGLGTPMAEELIDARVLWLSGKAMRITGNEVIEGAQYGQTWDVRML